MLLEKLGVKNYFVGLFIMLGVVLIFVFLAFIITSFIPESLGSKPINYSTEASYQFEEPWTIETDFLHISFPEGGLISFLHETEDSKSILIIGKTEEVEMNASQDKDNVGAIFMVIDNDFFNKIRADIIFLPIESSHLLETVDKFADNLVGVPTVWADTMPISFQAYNDIQYYHLIAEDGTPVLPPEARYSTAGITGAFFLYAIFIFIVIIIITILSPDHRYSRYWNHIHDTQPAAYNRYLVPLVLIALIASTSIVHMLSLDNYILFIINILILFFIAVSSRLGKADHLTFGFRLDKLGHGYLVAVITAFIIVLGFQGLPEGIDFQGAATFSHFFYLLFLVALPQELIWRGYLLTTLSRWINPSASLIIIALFALITKGILYIATQPCMLLYPFTYLELFIFVPGMAFILGYIYLRTENIMSCALLHGLILFLPGLFIY